MFFLERAASTEIPAGSPAAGSVENQFRSGPRGQVPAPSNGAWPLANNLSDADVCTQAHESVNLPQTIRESYRPGDGVAHGYALSD